MNTLGLFVNINEFRVIIPVLNEEVILKSERFKLYLKSIPFKVSFVDSCSSDDSLQIIQSMSSDVFTYKGDKSIYAACSLVARNIDEKYIIILPADCEVTFNQLLELKNDFSWGGFYKIYDQSSFFIKVYLFVQNKIRTKLFKNLVWTNTIFCKRELFLSHGESLGFLEDVVLSDNLKTIEAPILLKGPCKSSFRKYKGLFFKRLYVNLKVMFCFRFKVKSIEELKSIYSR